MVSVFAAAALIGPVSGGGVGRFVAVDGLVSIPLDPNTGPRGSVAARTANKGLDASPHCALPARSAC